MIRINTITISSKYVKEAKTIFRRHQSGNTKDVNDTGIEKVRSILDNLLKSSAFPSGQVQVARFWEKYRQSERRDRQTILKQIAINHHLDYERAKKAAASFISQNSSTEQRLKACERLQSALLPGYADVFNGVAKLDCGMKYLADFRADVLDLLSDQTSIQQGGEFHLLKAMSEHLKKLLSFAFNVGFLNLQRITWDSSCDMLQKVSTYEAVHPMRNWLDLKKRVGPYRRCYVYTHSSMPREPVVILHTALTQEISSSIASIVQQNVASEHADSTGLRDDDHIYEDPEQIGAAIFYSVTSTQKGLRGIELGNYLIKRVVGEVLKEFPHVKKLSSLSPVPGFREWLLVEMKKAQADSSSLHLAEITKEEKDAICSVADANSGKSFWNSMYHIISSNRWINNEDLSRCLEKPLLRLCAHYLVNAKRRSYALNSVAHFHLRNGAVMWRLNWKADVSPRGLDNSCGIMVNYRYYIEETERNSQEYLETFSVKISENVAQILKPSSVRR